MTVSTYAKRKYVHNIHCYIQAAPSILSLQRFSKGQEDARLNAKTKSQHSHTYVIIWDINRESIDVYVYSSYKLFQTADSFRHEMKRVHARFQTRTTRRSEMSKVNMSPTALLQRQISYRCT